MPSRVLLISINQCDDPYPVFPLGLGHLESALRAAGHSTRWLDFHVDDERVSNVVRDFLPDVVGISIRNIDDVVISRRETFFGRLTTLGPELRQLTRAPIVLGGSGFSLFPEQLLEVAGADFGICGEGEAPFAALVEAIERNADHAAIPGLVYRTSSGFTRNRNKPTEGSFLPADRPAPITNHYLRSSSMLNVQTQRGCAHHCCYCTYPLIEGRAWRRRQPDEVADEMSALQAQGARYVFVVDSVFNSSNDHATQVCEALLRRGVGIQWGCFLRPQGLTNELMRLMRRAGLRHVEFGSDSFCDEVLAAYGKRLTVADIQLSNDLARAADIECCHFLVCGGPGETRQTLATTFANSHLLGGAVILALVGMRVYPGTPLFRRAQAEHGFATDTNFLQPQYYLAPGLTQQEVFANLRDFSARSPNWIVGDPSPEYLSLAQRLRQRGVVGPLWSYFAAMQRLGLSHLQHSPD